MPCMETFPDSFREGLGTVKQIGTRPIFLGMSKAKAFTDFEVANRHRP